MDKLVTHLWYDTQAEEAAALYTSVFEDSKLGPTTRYPKSAEEIAGKPAGSVMTVEFELWGQPFIALNGGPAFTFNESMSLMVQCEDQAEIDGYWERLTADGGEEGPCGWLKDKFGLSWQIAPRRLGEMIQDPDQAKVERVTAAFMQMKKLDLAALEAAFAG